MGYGESERKTLLRDVVYRMELFVCVCMQLSLFVYIVGGEVYSLEHEADEVFTLEEIGEVKFNLSH